MQPELPNTFQYQSGQQITIPISVAMIKAIYGQCGSQVVGYSSAGWITSLTHTYGTTAFTYYEVDDGDVTDGVQQRAIYISEPEGAQQLYYYLHTIRRVGHQYLTERAGTIFRQRFVRKQRTSSSFIPEHLLLGTAAVCRAVLTPSRTALSYSLSMGLANLTGADYNKQDCDTGLLLGADDLSLTESMSQVNVIHRRMRPA